MSSREIYGWYSKKQHIALTDAVKYGMMRATKNTGETTWDDPTGVEGGGGDASYNEEYGEQAHDEVAAA